MHIEYHILNVSILSKQYAFNNNNMRGTYLKIFLQHYKNLAD